MKNNNVSFIFGGGPAAGYQTEYFHDNPGYLVSQKGRLATEVGFLTTLMKSGAIGVSLNFLILVVPAYLAMNKSNNKLCKLLAFFLVISWNLYFLETYQTVSITNFVNYIIIGMCISEKFRKLNDVEMKEMLNFK